MNLAYRSQVQLIKGKVNVFTSVFVGVFVVVGKGAE